FTRLSAVPEVRHERGEFRPLHAAQVPQHRAPHALGARCRLRHRLALFHPRRAVLQRLHLARSQGLHQHDTAARRRRRPGQCHLRQRGHERSRGSPCHADRAFGGHLSRRIWALRQARLLRALRERHPAQRAVDHHRPLHLRAGRLSNARILRDEAVLRSNCFMGHFSAVAGVLSLMVIVIPVVVRTSENMLLLVPNGLREAAAALGAPRSSVIRTVTWRAARAGIVTGVLLAVARISGETAPLLFTALNNNFWSTDLSQPIASLPVVIYLYATSAYEYWHRLAWAGALLITATVLTISIIARLL